MSISVTANEQGHIIFMLSVVDADDVAIAFEDIITPKWQLMKADGTVINRRSWAALTAAEWAIQGADLAYPGRCVIAVYFKYVTDVGGVVTTLQEYEQEKFKVNEIVGSPVT